MKANTGIHPKDEMVYDESCSNHKWTILIVHDDLILCIISSIYPDGNDQPNKCYHCYEVPFSPIQTHPEHK